MERGSGETGAERGEIQRGRVEICADHVEMAREHAEILVGQVESVAARLEMMPGRVENRPRKGNDRARRWGALIGYGRSPMRFTGSGKVFRRKRGSALRNATAHAPRRLDLVK